MIGGVTLVALLFLCKFLLPFDRFFRSLDPFLSFDHESQTLEWVGKTGVEYREAITAGLVAPPRTLGR